MRRFLKFAALAIVLPLIVFAGLAFLALRHELPPEPQLPGKIERGALEHGGRTRTWIAYVPVKPQAHPALVIVLHSSMSTAQQARHVYGYDFDLLAEEHGFIAVYPQGYKGHWNDCRVKGPFAAKIENVDDVGFLHALVDRLVKDHAADRAHVYVTGVSNGGAMTIRLALQTPDFARAYAAVVASVPTPENMAITPKGEPVSILLMNGTADPFNPWKGGDVVLYGVYGNRGPVLSTQASIDYFLKLDGLGGPPARTQFPDTDTSDGSTAERQRWTSPGRRSVTLIRIQDGGHGVPHPATHYWRLLGNSNRDFRGLNSRCGAHPGPLAVRNAGARRTAVRAHNHARRVAPCAGHACHPRDGSGRRFSRRDRRVQRSLLVRLDASRAGRDWDVLPHPLGARPVEPAMGPVPVVQQPEHGGIRIAIVFFGFFCLLTGYLIFKSTSRLELSVC